MEPEPAVGLDLGGTKIHAGVVEPNGRVVCEVRWPTEADAETDVVVNNLKQGAHAVLQEAGLAIEDVAGIGLGSPGPLDMRRGVILSPGNLPSLHGFPIVEALRQEFGTLVEFNNDANCFGLAEARFGAGRCADICCGLTLGTGLGGFLCLNGEVYNGPRGAGVELWCSPHLGDHVEERVSGRAVTRNYAKVTEEQHTAKELAGMARAGDETALRAWQEFGRDLAVPVAWLANIADPDIFVLGGSLAKAWDLFHAPMLGEVRKYINAVTRHSMRIERAALGDRAGMLGAAALVLSKL